MRPRIKTQVKIDVALIGQQIKDKQDRKREAFREALRDICNRDSVSIGEAKITLKKEIKWACVRREMQELCNEASKVLAS